MCCPADTEDHLPTNSLNVPAGFLEHFRAVLMGGFLILRQERW
nr:MAG TPA: hypothetical protein [Caudoviricetes sp.]